MRRTSRRFREANEQIEAGAVSIGHAGKIPFICECANEACTAIVRLTLDDYETVRMHPQRFFVCPQHESVAVMAGAARVVARRGGLVILDKVGVAGEIARERYEQLGTPAAEADRG